MKKHLLLIPALCFLYTCSETTPTAVKPDTTSPHFNISITSDRILTWYYDSSLTQWLKPSTYAVLCPNGFCFTISTGGSPDYTCTAFPDTFYGLIEYRSGIPGTINDTLVCHDDLCYNRKDGQYYDMTQYFNWVENALCNSSAAAYSRIGLCLSSSPHDTLHLWNSCLDTTLYTGNTGSFCLPKLPFPLDTAQQGVFIASTSFSDTVFLPAAYINAHDDFISFPSLQTEGE